MNRIVNYELEGRSASLLLSVYSVRKISERYGSLEDFGKKIGEFEPIKQMSELIWMVALLSEAGAKYNELTGGTPSDVFTPEELEILLPLSAENLQTLSQAVSEALTAGSKATIEIKSDPKN